MMILWLQLLILPVITSLSGESIITEHIKREAGKKDGPQAQNRFKDMESSLFKKLHNESDIKKLNFVNTWVNGIA